MRKIILVAAMVLASASAQASGSRSRSLSTATAAPQAATTTTATTQISEVAPAVEAPKYVNRPPAIPAAAPDTATAPAVTTTTPASAPVTTSKPKSTAKADKPRHQRTWTEARIVSELHRHGIYW